MPVMLQVSTVDDALRALVGDILGALPGILAGLLFLVLAVFVVKGVMMVLEAVLHRTAYGDSEVYRQFVLTIVAVFLWFGVLLSFLSIVGLDGIAVSLGTATGFVALGVAYALSGMIADVVSGIYLLRDPDFNPGYVVEVDGMTGEIQTIELRKTRFAVDGDTVVRRNADIEKKWRKLATPDDANSEPAL